MNNKFADNLSFDSFDRVTKLRMARSILTDKSDLHALSFEDDVEIRKLVAQNPMTKRISLRQLAYDSSLVVRELVATNPHTDPDTLEALAHFTLYDDDRKIFNDIKLAVAANLSTPSFVLAKLSEDSEPEVRQAVAKNLATEMYILKKLVVHDPEHFVQIYAKENLRLREKTMTDEKLVLTLMHKYNVEFLPYVARDLYTDESILHFLINCQNVKISSMATMTLHQQQAYKAWYTNEYTLHRGCK